MSCLHTWLCISCSIGDYISWFSFNYQVIRMNNCRICLEIIVCNVPIVWNQSLFLLLIFLDYLNGRWTWVEIYEQSLALKRIKTEDNVKAVDFYQQNFAFKWTLILIYALEFCLQDCLRNCEWWIFILPFLWQWGTKGTMEEQGSWFCSVSFAMDEAEISGVIQSLNCSLFAIFVHE